MAITPAVAVTAYASAGDRKKALFSGYQAHLTKPIDPVRLDAVIRQVCG